VWQFKSGNDASPSRLAKEAVKKGVLETLRGNGNYVIALSKKCNASRLKAREKAVKAALRTKKVADSRATILDVDRISNWASEHPSLILLSAFNRPIGGSIGFESWEKDPRHRTDFVLDDARRKMITEIQSFVKTKGGPVHFRIIGRRGIGKTRLVMESLRIRGIQERVIYARDPSVLPHELWTWLRFQKSTSSLVVIDECEEIEGQDFKAEADSCEGRVRLITIGVGEPFPLGSSPQHHFLEKLDQSSMRQLLNSSFRGFAPEVVDWILRITAGYVRLAVACAEALSLKPGLSIEQLSQSPQIRILLETLLPDASGRKVMQALSLLTRVGIEGDIALEGKLLADMVEVAWSDFARIVEDMYERGLVGKKGRYRYVTPDLLAQRLAADIWKARYEDIRRLLDRLPIGGSRDSFYDRLKDLGSDENAREVLQELVSHKNISSLDSLNDEQASRIVYSVALADPLIASEALQRLLGGATIEHLRSFGTGRRYIVMALGYLKWFKETFRSALLLLLALAEAETESYANNATGTWTSTFQLALGGTEVSMLDRLSILDEILLGDSISRKHLALKALEAVFDENPLRSSGSEDIGSKPVPQEWFPRTKEQVNAACLFGLKLIGRTMKDSDPTVSKGAEDVLISSARTAVRFGLASPVISLLEELTPKTDEDKRETREGIRLILDYEVEKLGANERLRLIAIEQKLAGTDFRGSLHRWVGQWSFGDWDIQERDGGATANERAAMLAKQAMENPEELRAELDWLYSDEARNVTHFGKRLGELDTARVWLDELSQKARDAKQPLLLASYLWGRIAAGDQKFVENLVEKWASRDPRLSQVVLATSSQLNPSNRAVERILELLKNRSILTEDLIPLLWSPWPEKLPSAAFQLLVSKTASNSEQILYAALSATDRRLKLFPGERTALSDLVWELLGNPVSATSTMAMHFWEEIGKQYAESEPAKLAETIVKVYGSSDVLMDKDDSPMKALAQAAKANEKAVWEVIGTALLATSSSAYRLQLALRGWFVSLVTTSLLLDWARRHLPNGPVLLARLTEPAGIPLDNLPRALLEKLSNCQCYVCEFPKRGISRQHD
jgi:hypothetical protein